MINLYTLLEGEQRSNRIIGSNRVSDKNFSRAIMAKRKRASGILDKKSSVKNKAKRILKTSNSPGEAMARAMWHSQDAAKWDKAKDKRKVDTSKGAKAQSRINNQRALRRRRLRLISKKEQDSMELQ